MNPKLSEPRTGVEPVTFECRSNDQLSYQDSLEREGYICGYDDDMNLLCADHKLSSECIMMIL